MGVGFAACIAVSYFSSSLNAFDKYEIVTAGNTQYADESTSTDLTEQEGDKQITDASKTREQAIAYLKNNKVWDKTEMEQYPDLKGLWDDLNNFNFNTIVREWADILNAAERDQLVVEVKLVARSCKGTLDIPYAEKGSTKITYRTYLCYVSNVRQGKMGHKEAKPKTQTTSGSKNMKAGNKQSAQKKSAMSSAAESAPMSNQVNYN